MGRLRSDGYVSFIRHHSTAAFLEWCYGDIALGIAERAHMLKYSKEKNQ